MDITGFFAYSSTPAVSEIVHEAIGSINGSGVIKIKPWESLKISGQSVIGVICEEINKADIFLCDLTYLNSNVLFELGYAIAKNKRIVVFLDPSIEKAKFDYERFNLSTLGYLSYNNEKSMIEQFFKVKPYNNIDKTVLNEISHSIKFANSGLLFLKSAVDTQASIKLHQKLDRSKIKPLIVDDPQEIRMQMHTWYVEKASNTFAVVGHLLSDDRAGKDLHNAKVSFVCGLAYGFEKKVIMLAQEPYTTPLDYRHLLKKHSTAAECEKAIESWLKDSEFEYIEAEKKAITYSESAISIQQLKNIDIGDYIAEQEYERIKDYFLETPAYREALKSRYTIFIGRKGSGKSAILYQLEYALSNDPRNHICTIKPISYELNGLISILKNVEGSAEKGYLIESLWKYLIYTEIAKSIYEMLQDKPDYYEEKQYEKAIEDIINANKEIFLNDFSIRLELAIQQFGMIGLSEKGHSQRIRISEILHDKLLAKLRDALMHYFENRNRVVVLIDNLDKTWKHSEDITYLSQFLLGLLSVSNRIADDFRYERKDKIITQFSIVIFLRTDIFTYIYREARERDKIKYYAISWDDSELLCQVVEERIKASTGIEDNRQVWFRYFCEKIDGIPIKEYITKNILSRPRDILFLTKYALANAVTRRHDIVEEKDVTDALERYSQHAIDSLIVENGINVDDFEKILYEFAGNSKILSKKTISELLHSSGAKNVDLDSLIEILCERCFLGRMIGKDEFRYQNNHLETEKILVLSRKYVQESEENEQYFEVNIPYRKYLEIKG